MALNTPKRNHLTPLRYQW